MEGFKNMHSRHMLLDIKLSSNDDKILEVLWNFHEEVFQELDILKKLLKSLQSSIDKSIPEDVNEYSIHDISLSPKKHSNMVIQNSYTAQNMSFENKKQIDIPVHGNIIATAKQKFPDRVNEDWTVRRDDDESNASIDSVYNVGLPSVLKSINSVQQSPIESNNGHNLKRHDQFVPTEICIIVDDVSIDDIGVTSQHQKFDEETTELTKGASAFQSPLEVIASSTLNEFTKEIIKQDGSSTNHDWKNHNRFASLDNFRVVVEDSSVNDIDVTLQHLKTDNDAVEFINNTPTPQSSPQVIASSSVNETCQLCDKEFDSVSQFEEHFFEHAEEKHMTVNNLKENDMVDFEGTDIKLTSQLSKETKKLVCQFCNKSFEHKMLLQNHFAEHSKEKRYKCSFCGKLYFSVLGARLHAQCHVTPKLYKCDKCNKLFTNRKDLSMHFCTQLVKKYKSSHNVSGDFPLNDMIKFIGSHTLIETGNNALKKKRLFVCQFCNKKCKSISMLEDHLTVHTKEKRYKCICCSKLFCSKLGARKHVRRHVTPPEGVE